MIELAPGWTVDVERGPDWLIVRLHSPPGGEAEGTPLAETLYDLLEQHLAHRMVVELDELQILCSYLVGQLVLLHKRIYTHGGVLRLSGVSDNNQEVLRACRLDSRFPQFRNRLDAVLGQQMAGAR